MNFKDTLLMPKTDFPMRGGLPNKEPQIQENGMQKINIKSIRKNKGNQSYILHDGPPYANGSYIWDMHLIKLLRILSSVIKQCKDSMHHMFQAGIRMVYQLNRL